MDSYSDDSHESLAVVRWDRSLSGEVVLPILRILGSGNSDSLFGLGDEPSTLDQDVFSCIADLVATLSDVQRAEDLGAVLVASVSLARSVDLVSSSSAVSGSSSTTASSPAVTPEPGVVPPGGSGSVPLATSVAISSSSGTASGTVKPSSALGPSRSGPGPVSSSLHVFWLFWLGFLLAFWLDFFWLVGSLGSGCGLA